jgi:hypothetical protein
MAVALRVLLSLALIAGGFATPAALAMSLAAPQNHAAAGTDLPNCHDHAAPAKRGPLTPPCCAGGKCLCSCINGPGLPVMFVAAPSAAAPVWVAHRDPRAAPPPLLSNLLRPPIG